MSFWKKVCSELDYQSVSRKELAHKIDVPVATINRAIERDSQPFAIDALLTSKALNVSLEYLLGLPETKNDRKKSDENQSHQIELFKKYHSIIEALESLPQNKQKAAVEIVKQILEFGK
ncbi:MAG: helix-turn-helix transcriptional regulator [Spirochaetia bacterium]|nr:helix-turn-helix transcriptional regulator [Spirochaetia bacterium]